MRTASASRVAWFLQFRQIFRFPKYFLAPSRALVRHPRPGNDDLEDHRPTGLRLGRWPAVSGQRRSVETPMFQRSQAFRGPTFSPYPGVPRSAGLAPEIETGQKSNPSTTALFVKPAMRGNQPNNQALSKHPSTAPQSFLRRSARPGAFAVGSASRPARQFAADESFAPWRSTDIPLAQLHVAHAHLMRTDAEALAGAIPPPAADFDSARQVGQNASFIPQNPSAGHEKERDRARGLSGSTVHIDGSALGRWAIQYLERALAKPANGMTGVDPRACLPRGRVSPF